MKEESKISEEELEERRLEIMKTCDHEFIAREYFSQPFGTCLCCGKTVIN